MLTDESTPSSSIGRATITSVCPLLVVNTSDCGPVSVSSWLNTVTSPSTSLYTEVEKIPEIVLVLVPSDMLKLLLYLVDGVLAEPITVAEFVLSAFWYVPSVSPI